MSKKGWLIVLALIIILIVMFVALYFYEIDKIRSETEGKRSSSVISNFNVVPSLEDEITENTTWCGTFNLIWNDLKNDLVKQDIVFENQPKIVNNLNKGTFGEYKNVSYFGINSSTEEAVRDQIKVLYYNSKEDFAVKLLTKSEDEVIISKGNSENTFAQIYGEIQNASEKLRVKLE